MPNRPLSAVGAAGNGESRMMIHYHETCFLVKHTPFGNGRKQDYGLRSYPQFTARRHCMAARPSPALAHPPSAACLQAYAGKPGDAMSKGRKTPPLKITPDAAAGLGARRPGLYVL